MGPQAACEQNFLTLLERLQARAIGAPGAATIGRRQFLRGREVESARTTLMTIDRADACQ
jgi:hypothetical protein